MGLKEALKGAAKAAVLGLGNIATTGTYVSIGTKNYNRTTGGTTSTDTSQSVKTIVLAEYKSKEKDNLITNAIYQTALIPQLDLTATPKMQDYITIANVKHEVVDIRQDPAGAMWELDVRIS